MEKHKAKKSIVPKFTSESEEAKWWASAEGRALLKCQPKGSSGSRGGSKLLSKLVRANSIQIALPLQRVDGQ